MKVALEEIEIVGVPTTVPLHQILMQDERFIGGDFNTTYLNSLIPRVKSSLLDMQKFAAVVAAIDKATKPTQAATTPTQSEGSKWRTDARAQLMKTNH
jgi:acetyl/propionyl-CoA carboxylase alpha subunit